MKKLLYVCRLIFLGILFFGIAFTIIRMSFYKAIPSPLEYFFPITIGTIIGAGAAFWRLRSKWYEIHLKESIEERTKELLASNEQLRSTTVSKEYVDNILQSMAETLIVIDTDETIRTANQAALDLLDYSDHELIGKNATVVFAPGKAIPIAVLIEAKQIRNIETVFLSKNKRTIPALFSSSIMHDNDGKLQGLVCIAQDVSERKQIEEERKKIAEQRLLSQKLEALGTLSGGIAHEFNNILGTIYGYSELLLNLADDGSREKEFVGNIHQAVERASDIVNQILTFGRMDSQRQVILHVPQVIHDSYKILRASIPATIDIGLNIDENVHPIFADKTQLHQIIINLCTNAHHAMLNETGTIDISLREASDEEVAASPSSNHNLEYLKLTIRDDGMGISQTHKEYLFDPFFTTKEIGKGTGLGLSVVHSIVERHHGWIDIESEPGKGTSVSVFFPITNDCAIDESTPTKQEFTGKGRILVIEDEKALAKFYQIALSNHGYDVVAFSNSAKALETFLENPESFDLVLTDQTMQGLTGTNLSQKMLTVRPSLPIILTTGFSESVSEESALAMGIRAFFFKPIKMVDLTRTISRLIAEQVS